MRIALTRREQQVVVLLAAGAPTYREVAETLDCAPQTVRNHVNAIAARLPYPHLTPKAAVCHYAVEMDKDGVT